MKHSALTSLLMSALFFLGPLNNTAIPASPTDLNENNQNVLRFGVHVSEMGNLDPHFAG